MTYCRETRDKKNAVRARVKDFSVEIKIFYHFFGNYLVTVGAFAFGYGRGIRNKLNDEFFNIQNESPTSGKRY
jgi:hypothetical protein